eukprot:4780485-Prymnesium_polylepis.2
MSRGTCWPWLSRFVLAAGKGMALSEKKKMSVLSATPATSSSRSMAPTPASSLVHAVYMAARSARTWTLSGRNGGTATSVGAYRRGAGQSAIAPSLPPTP